MDVGVNRLRALPVFRNIPLSDLEEFARNLYGRKILKGDVLFQEGTPADGAVLVLAGRFSASLGEGDKKRTVGDVWPGDLVGDAALFATGGIRNATVTAMMDTECAAVDQQVLANLPTNRAVIALEQQLLGLMARRIRQANLRIEQTWRPTPTPPASAPGRGGEPEKSESLGTAILRFLGFA